MFGFTDYYPETKELKSIDENDMRYNIGWAVIAIVTLYIIVNMYFILKGMFQGIKNIIMPKLAALLNFRIKKESIKE